MTPETITDMVKVRSFARKYGDIGKACDVERILDEAGVDIEDGPYGTSWMYREDVEGVLALTRDDVVEWLNGLSNASR